MAVNTAAMVARSRFGAELKNVREATRNNGVEVKQLHVAQAMGLKSYHRYSRIERGETWPKDDEWEQIAGCLQMDPVTHTRLDTMRTEGMSLKSAWWNDFEDEFAESLIEFVAYEDAAARVVTCGGNTVPGLLQTPDYARALSIGVASYVMPPDIVERSVELRGKRRRIFEKSTPPSVEAIFSEGALWQRVGGRDVMLPQLEALLEDAQRQRVSLRIVPFSARATSMYMLHLLEFGKDEKPLVAFDSMTGMVFRKSVKEFREFRHYVTSMRDLSLSALDSINLVKSIKKELSRG